MDQTTFFENVFDVVREIPHGRVTNYGAIAKYLGTGKASRMVGWAMNKSHTCPTPVPAHRVVNRNGMLTGKAHFNPPERMQLLLEKEGLIIENDTIKNFKERFWDPGIELAL